MKNRITSAGTAADSSTQHKLQRQANIAANPLLAAVKSAVAVSDTAIVECCVTKSGKYAVAVISHSDNEMFYQLFENVETMGKNVHETIAFACANIEGLKTVVTDCSIGYLPKVVKFFKAKKIKQVFPKPIAGTVVIKKPNDVIALHNVERKMHQLSCLH